MSLTDYLRFEEGNPVRHEYVSGWVHAMSGGTTRHNLITLNMVHHLRDPARRRGCRVFASDVKVRAAVDRIYYPDIVIACGKAADVDLVVEQPSLVAEVTSPGTRATDRREKLDAYLRIDSLRTYLIVDQRRRYVVACARDTRDEWVREEYTASGAIAIPFLDLQLDLEAIYDDVTLPPLALKEDQEWDDAAWADFEEAEARAEEANQREPSAPTPDRLQ